MIFKISYVKHPVADFYPADFDLGAFDHFVAVAHRFDLENHFAAVYSDSIFYLLFQQFPLEHGNIQNPFDDALNLQPLSDEKYPNQCVK